MIVACDKIEGIGEKITKTCYRLQTTVTDDSINQELILLEQTLENLPPCIKAAGFIVIDRRILFKYCSIATSYIIVALQFHLKFKKPIT